MKPGFSGIVHRSTVHISKIGRSTKILQDVGIDRHVGQPRLQTDAVAAAERTTSHSRVHVRGQAAQDRRKRATYTVERTYRGLAYASIVRARGSITRLTPPIPSVPDALCEIDVLLNRMILEMTNRWETNLMVVGAACVNARHFDSDRNRKRS